jgi:hypothetical protein
MDLGNLLPCGLLAKGDINGGFPKIIPSRVSPPGTDNDVRFPHLIADQLSQQNFFCPNHDIESGQVFKPCLIQIKGREATGGLYPDLAKKDAPPDKFHRSREITPCP